MYSLRLYQSKTYIVIKKENIMTLAQKNLERWNNSHISAENGVKFKAVADRLSAPEARKRYEGVAKSIKEAGYGLMPWEFIAVVHEREAGQKWTAQLGQGDPLNKKSTHIPIGRGPFETWEAGAFDALVNCPPYAAKNKDWSIGGTLAMLEQYNGLGYANQGLPSPYIWAGTDQYAKGKYTADHVFSPNVVDKQLGCAGLLKFLGYGKSAPTGAGTLTGAVVIAGGAAAATTSPTWWMWTQDHWLAIALVVIGTGLFIDLAIAIFNNEKNNLNVG